jgi:predicted nuclease of predicted toxin-antitoxin system
MRLFIDQDVYKITIEFLRRQGHDIVCAKEVGLSGAADEELLIWARRNKRILITRDKGFGALVFVQNFENEGVILLQINPATIELVHKELSLFFSKHSDIDFHNCFCVIEPQRHRIRRFTP